VPLPLKTILIFGTRPEAIKLAPVLEEMRRRPGEFDPVVCVTAQHRNLLDQVLQVFEIVPRYDLQLMRPAQTLSQCAARAVAGLEPVLDEVRPDMVVVQGDTTTTFCGALAAFYARVPVGHVEAGLRTGDPTEPFPEEMNRVLTTRLASLHFAATRQAAANLEAEGVPASRIAVTGNPGIDALLQIRDALESGRLTVPEWTWLDPRKRLILVTAHRRESFGEGFRRICAALERLGRRPDVQIVYPVHPNPNVRDAVRRWLAGAPNVVLLDPLDYIPFVDLMRRAYLLVTDSGGIQEEAPSLGKPVVVMREKTERPEGGEAGASLLAGTAVERIVDSVAGLLDHPEMYRRMSAVHNPYGDGRAGRRIADAIVSFFK
jgi:UDP-N-acetylglucosamine 2-epimerase (non-hydrolysing)